MSDESDFDYVKARIEEVLGGKDNITHYDLSTQNYPDVKFKKIKEAVNHPEHYSPGEYEVINVIEAWNLGFHLGNAIKYISRAGKKDPAKTKEDLRKAVWYIERYIQNKDLGRF